MTFWDIIDANMSEPASGIVKLLFKIVAFLIYNWFWIKWICIAVIVFILAKAIKKHNKKVDEQKREENKQ